MEGNNQFAESMKKQLACTDADGNSFDLPLNADGEVIGELGPKEQQNVNSHLIVGEEYKITGGKYKKFKTGILQTINPTYSDVKVSATTSSGEITTDKICKVKNTYLMRLNPPGIEMPTEDDLLVVPDLEQYLADNPQADMVIEENPPHQEPEPAEPVQKFAEGHTKIIEDCQKEINRLKAELERELLFSTMLLEKLQK